MTSPPSERNGKAALRAQMLSRRDQLSEAVRTRSASVIADRCEATLLAFRAGSVIAVYAVKGSEVEPRGIDQRARQLGLRVVYPRVVPGQAWLDFHLTELSAMRPARFGLSEPLPAAPRIDLSEIDCFFVPGIAFDSHGGRLGWGRGYYDHTFARAPQAMRIGLAFECQVVERVPMADHDIPLHGLFTEAEIRRFGV